MSYKEKELEIIKSERDYDTMIKTINISKTTDELIYNAAQHMKISYEEALELIIHLGQNEIFL